MGEDNSISWLVEFAGQIRESTLKRLAQVKPQDRCWRPGPGIMSFADTLCHLIDVDRWVLLRLAGGDAADVNPCPRAGDGIDWALAIKKLQCLGSQREQAIRQLTPQDLTARVAGAGNGDPGPLRWELIVRRGLDHEIHHRGELQLMLSLRYGA